MRKTELDDQILLNAVDEMERGLIDADLRGGVYKKTYSPSRQRKTW
nr:type II toxin-antitoxin system RelE/ParE family toxin [Bilophila wadsworthia]